MQRLIVHRRIDIYVNTHGLFCTDASSDVGELTDPTLDGLKKKIDELGGKKKMREPAFLLDARWSDEKPQIVNCVVTSVIRDRHDTSAWVIRHGERGHSKERADQVYPATKQNDALAKRWLQLKMQIRKLEKQAEIVERNMTSMAELAKQRQQASADVAAAKQS